ncbi:MAG TPA: UDP-N-acetylglucosamine 2-epimerase (non-hydrolyzing) [Firmicutes bacterium]|jgi:UDP-N-acetylglucosamine 2-epimerase (non-hydrolysing)|nr:UDP-N-acetylglucosamine 2-epimerase (non-hydrolyzing) [Bacillota bacterium]
MAKFAVVFGTRPEAIKMAPVVLAMRQNPKWDVRVICTGQHREMLHQVLEVFQIRPDYDLDIMTHGQTLEDITTRVLQGVGEVFRNWHPDLVLVHGDTTTAFAAALAAFYAQVPIAHVEAGLRTADLGNPFPEEANRRLTDVLAEIHFAPTEQAAENIRREVRGSKEVYITGNTVIDALLQVVEEDYQFRTPALAGLDFSKPIVVVTVHRRENWGTPLVGICQALREIVAAHQCQIVVAMHQNPRLQEVFRRELDGVEHVYLIPAPDYREFANLMKRSKLLLTDSGGLQEEAPALNVPVLVLREQTERPEGVAAGTCKVVGTAPQRIVESVAELLTNAQVYNTMALAPNPYGDGRAAQRICGILEQKYTV